MPYQQGSSTEVSFSWKLPSFQHIYKDLHFNQRTPLKRGGQGLMLLHKNTQAHQFLTSQGQLKPTNIHRLAHVSNIHQCNLSRCLFEEFSWGCQHQLGKKKLFWWSYRRQKSCKQKRITISPMVIFKNLFDPGKINICYLPSPLTYFKDKIIMKFKVIKYIHL